MMNDRRKQIYEVALVALSEKGYHGTSLRDLAAAVDIQTPSLYNYVDSKQDLLFQLMRFIMEDLTSGTRSAVAVHVGDPLRGLRAAIEAFVLFNITHLNEAAVSDAGLSILNKNQRQSIIEMRNEFDAIYTEIILEGMDRAIFIEGDPSVVKNVITSACARVYMWYRPGGRYTPDELARTLSDYLTAGMRRVDTTEEP